MSTVRTRSAVRRENGSATPERHSFHGDFEGQPSGAASDRERAESVERTSDHFGFLLTVKYNMETGDGPPRALWTPAAIAGLIAERLRGEAPKMEVLPDTKNQVAVIPAGLPFGEGATLRETRRWCRALTEFPLWGGLPAQVETAPQPIQEIRLRQMELLLQKKQATVRAKARRKPASPPSHARKARKAASESALRSRRNRPRADSTDSDSPEKTPTDSPPHRSESDELPTDTDGNDMFASSDGYETAASSASGASRRPRRRRPGERRRPKKADKRRPRGRPKLQVFADEKDNLSYAAWRHDVEAKVSLGFPEVDIVDSMLASLTGGPGDLAHDRAKRDRDAGKSPTVAALLEELDIYYGAKMSYDEMDSACLRIKQEAGERVGPYGIRLMNQVAQMQHYYPKLLPAGARDRKMAHRFYGGLKDSIRDKLSWMKMMYKDNLVYGELLTEALRLEQEEASREQETRRMRPPPPKATSYVRFPPRKPDFRRVEPLQARPMTAETDPQPQEESETEAAEAQQEEDLEIREGEMYDGTDNVLVKLQHVIQRSMFPPGACYNCGSQGHMARDCTEKQRTPSFKDEWYSKNGRAGSARPTPYKRAFGSRTGSDHPPATAKGQPTGVQAKVVSTTPTPQASQ